MKKRNVNADSDNENAEEQAAPMGLIFGLLDFLQFGGEAETRDGIG